MEADVTPRRLSSGVDSVLEGSWKTGSGFLKLVERGKGRRSNHGCQLSRAEREPRGIHGQILMASVKGVPLARFRNVIFYGTCVTKREHPI